MPNVSQTNKEVIIADDSKHEDLMTFVKRQRRRRLGFFWDTQPASLINYLIKDSKENDLITRDSGRTTLNKELNVNTS